MRPPSKSSAGLGLRLMQSTGLILDIALSSLILILPLFLLGLRPLPIYLTGALLVLMILWLGARRLTPHPGPALPMRGVWIVSLPMLAGVVWPLWQGSQWVIQPQRIGLFAPERTLGAGLFMLCGGLLFILLRSRLRARDRFHRLNQTLFMLVPSICILLQAAFTAWGRGPDLAPSFLPIYWIAGLALTHRAAEGIGGRGAWLPRWAQIALGWVLLGLAALAMGDFFYLPLLLPPLTWALHRLEPAIKWPIYLLLALGAGWIIPVAGPLPLAPMGPIGLEAHGALIPHFEGVFARGWRLSLLQGGWPWLMTQALVLGVLAYGFRPLFRRGAAYAGPFQGAALALLFLLVAAPTPLSTGIYLYLAALFATMTLALKAWPRRFFEPLLIWGNPPRGHLGPVPAFLVGMPFIVLPLILPAFPAIGGWIGQSVGAFHHRLAQAAKAQGNLAEAENHLARAISAEPFKGSWHFSQVDLLIAQGKNPAALAWLDRALWLSKGQAISAEQFKELLTLIENLEAQTWPRFLALWALDLSPPLQKALVAQAPTQPVPADLDLAFETQLQWARLMPDGETWLKSARQKAQSPEEKNRLLDGAIQLNALDFAGQMAQALGPRFSDKNRRRLIEAYFAAGQCEAGQDYLGERGEALWGPLLADCWLKAGDVEAARALLPPLDPQIPTPWLDAHRQLAETTQAEGDWRAVLEILVSREPQRVDYHLKLAELYRVADRYLRAQRQLEACLEKNEGAKACQAALAALKSK